MEQQHAATNHIGGDDAANEPRHIGLAREAILAGMSRERVIAVLIKRIHRDEGYLTIVDRRDAVDAITDASRQYSG